MWLFAFFYISLSVFILSKPLKQLRLPKFIFFNILNMNSVKEVYVKVLLLLFIFYTSVMTILWLLPQTAPQSPQYSSLELSNASGQPQALDALLKYSLSVSERSERFSFKQKKS